MNEAHSNGGGPAGRVLFHDFELDLRTTELRRAGRPVGLQPQAAAALVLLVSEAGRLVPRDELVRTLWPDTIVEYDQGLNNVIRLLRRALGDDPRHPRFIATVPRRGYRFVAPVEIDEPPRPGAPPAPLRPTPRTAIPSRLVAGSAAVAVVLALGTLWLALGRRAADPPRLAVLPFAGTDRETELLGRSLAEELTRELSVLPGASLQLIGHGSALRAARESPRPLAAGRRLGASHVVAGALAEDGDALVLRVSVVRTGDGAELWQDEVRTSWRRLLPTERALAERIARAVGRAVGAGPASREEGGEDGPPPEAVEDYLRATYLVREHRWSAAEPLLRRVIDAAPGFARAHVALGRALLSSSDAAMGASEARRLATAALRLDPDSAEAHLLRSQVALTCDWNWRLAEAHLDRAHELAAGSAEVHLARAVLLSSLGRHGEALEAAETARTLDPLSTVLHGDLAMLRFWAGDWEGVLHETERLLELEPGEGTARSLRLEALLRAGRWEPARELALSLYGAGHGLGSAPGSALRDRILSLQEASLRAADPGATRAMLLASLAAQRGQPEEALEYLEEAVRLRSPYAPFVATDPHFASLSREAAFRDLLARIGHPLAGRPEQPARPVALASDP